MQDLECDVMNAQQSDEDANDHAQDASPSNVKSNPETSDDKQGCPAKEEGFISGKKTRINNVKTMITFGFILGFIPLAW